MQRIATLLLFTATIALAQSGVRVVPGPGSIDSPGSYQLVRDVTGSIQITANDVTLDLNGHSVNGPTGLTSTGIQILSAQGVEIYGGSINNFGIGVQVVTSGNVRLHDLRIRATDLAVPAPPPEVGIMVVESQNVVVEDNAIYHVGLGIFVRGGMSRGNRIVNNTVTAGENGLLGICYNPTPTDPMGPRGDLVSGNVINGFRGGINLSDLSMANIIRGNTIAYRMTAITFTDMTNIEMDNVAVQLP